MRSFRVEGVIVNTRRFGERDKVLTIFTKERGKITALAKGARVITSRRAPYLDLLQHNTFQLHQTHSWPVVTEVRPMRPNNPSLESLADMAQRHLAGELVDRFLREGQENYELYIALIELLPSPSQFFLRYQLSLLHSVGYRPEMNTCVICSRELFPEGLVFSASHGGLVCLECSRTRVVEGVGISPVAVKVMRFLLDADSTHVRLLSLSTHVAAEIQSVLLAYIEWLLERRVNSGRFL